MSGRPVIVSPDGDQFAVVRVSDSEQGEIGPRIRVVENWFAEQR